MEKELTYLNADGSTVFTSHFLKNRGTCCKTTCLHCPYGFTLKKIGMTFKEATEDDVELIESLIKTSKTPELKWREFDPSNVQIILVKDVVCGVALKTKLQIKHVFLKEHFQHQGLSLELIESYYFI
jgi:hypothetical protein